MAMLPEIAQGASMQKCNVTVPDSDTYGIYALECTKRLKGGEHHPHQSRQHRELAYQPLDVPIRLALTASSTQTPGNSSATTAWEERFLAR